MRPLPPEEAEALRRSIMALPAPHVVRRPPAGDRLVLNKASRDRLTADGGRYTTVRLTHQALQSIDRAGRPLSDVINDSLVDGLVLDAEQLAACTALMRAYAGVDTYSAALTMALRRCLWEERTSAGKPLQVG